MTKGILEKLMVEEQKVNLEEHSNKANGYSTRDLLTLPRGCSRLTGP